MFQMETDRLRQFCLIVETGSLSRAAELLRVTHSALSKSMTNLQGELKVKLLQPSGRGLSVTKEGLRIYQSAKSFLKSEKELFFSTSTDDVAELRIGTVEIFSLALASGLSSAGVEFGPLKLLDIEPGLMEQQISAGNLDFGITYLPFPQANLKLIPMGKFKLGCFHRSDVFESLDLCDLPFVVPAKLLPENPLGIKERDGWHDTLFPRKIAFRTNLLSTALDLTMDGQCALVIPHFVARVVNATVQTGKYKLAERKFPAQLPNPQHTAYVMCSEHYVEDQRLRSICKIIRTALRMH